MSTPAPRPATPAPRPATPRPASPRRAEARRVALRQAGTYLAATYAAVLALALAFPDNGLVTVAMMFTPTLGVGVAVGLATLRSDRRAAWAGVGFGLPPWRGLLVALAVPAAIVVSSYAVAALVGVARFPGIGAIHLGELALSLLLTGTVLALGEEIGWRGYLLPRLTSVLPEGRSALLTGAAHAAFHLPALLLTSAYQSTGARLVVVPTVMVTITFAGVFYAWLRRWTGSIWPVALAHSAFNTLWGYGLGAAVAVSPAALAHVSTETGIATMLLATVLAAGIAIRESRTQRQLRSRS